MSLQQAYNTATSLTAKPSGGGGSGSGGAGAAAGAAADSAPKRQQLNRPRVVILKELGMFASGDTCKVPVGFHWIDALTLKPFAGMDNICIEDGKVLCSTTTVYTVKLPHVRLVREAAAKSLPITEVMRAAASVRVSDFLWAKDTIVSEEDAEEEGEMVATGSGSSKHDLIDGGNPLAPDVVEVQVAVIRIACENKGQSPVAGFVVGSSCNRMICSKHTGGSVFHPFVLHKEYQAGLRAIIEVLMSEEGAMAADDVYMSSKAFEDIKGTYGARVTENLKEVSASVREHEVSKFVSHASAVMGETYKWTRIAHGLLLACIQEVVLRMKSERRRRGKEEGEKSVICVEGGAPDAAPGASAAQPLGMTLKVFASPVARLLVDIVETFCMYSAGWMTAASAIGDGKSGLDLVNAATTKVMGTLKSYNDHRDKELMSLVRASLVSLALECKRMVGHEPDVVSHVMFSTSAATLTATIEEHKRDSAGGSSGAGGGGAGGGSGSGSEILAKIPWQFPTRLGSF